MLGANRDYAKTAASTTNYFGFDLGYDKNTIIPSSGSSIGTYATPAFNGNIEGTVWKSKGDGEIRKYDFNYDAVNRLMKADFNQYTSGTFNKNALVDFSMKMGDGVSTTTAYDANGNIKRMQQWGLEIGSSTQIDDMLYSYFTNTNKLQAVTEQGTGVIDHKLGDFTDKNTGTTDYGYDANGNMVTDLNKKMNGTTGQSVSSGGAIVYNFLNLPQAIQVKKDDGSSKGSITYAYDASGNKLKKVTIDLSTTGKTITTTTTYISGFIYESKTTSPANTPNDDYTDKLQFTGHEEGRIRNKDDGSFAYDYFIKDHLGNVRMVLTEEQKIDAYPAATMETATALPEESLYTNLNTTRSDKPAGYPNDTYTNPNEKVARLKAVTGSQKIGPSIVLKVMAGDKFNLRVSSWYKTAGATPGSPVNPLNDLLATLINGVSGASAGKFTSTELSSSGVLTPSVTNFLDTRSVVTSKPKAYVNWILVDEQFKLVSSSSSVEQVGNNEEFKIHTKTNLPIDKNGYLYVFVSNETPNIDVFFDNLQVTHIHGPLLEETHYYPFGLTMAGISSKAAEGVENKSLFLGKELQSKEFSDRSGLELYDFSARMYDQQTGHFPNPDALSEKFYQWSPYSYSFNNPIFFSDPTGMAASPVYDQEGTFLGTDNQGLKGDAIVMDKSKFQQGMKHENAVKNNLGGSGLKDDAAFNKLADNYINLPSRPDYDGFVTIQEGIDWAKSHVGALNNPTPENMLYLDASKLNFGNISTSRFDNLNLKTPVNLLNAHNLSVSLENETVRATVYALGRVDMMLTNRESRSVQIVNDFNKSSDRATDYDWNTGGGPLRSTLIRAERLRAGLNDSHGFRVYYYGTGTLNTSADWTIKPSQYR